VHKRLERPEKSAAEDAIGTTVRPPLRDLSSSLRTAVYTSCAGCEIHVPGNLDLALVLCADHEYDRKPICVCLFDLCERLGGDDDIA
jgi:hypothetical protein